MSGAESVNYKNLFEHDLDKLTHASQENISLEAPEISDKDLEEATYILNALAKLRDSERELSAISRLTLDVSEQDLRALQFLVISQRRGNTITPSDIASHIGISAASTTKLLNRLESKAHIWRVIHPSDRRAFKIQVRPETEAILQRSVGRQQARRLLIALQLSSEERAIVAGFLDELTRGINYDREIWRSKNHHE